MRWPAGGQVGLGRQRARMHFTTSRDEAARCFCLSSGQGYT